MIRLNQSQLPRQAKRYFVRVIVQTRTQSELTDRTIRSPKVVAKNKCRTDTVQEVVLLNLMRLTCQQSVFYGSPLFNSSAVSLAVELKNLKV